MGLGAISFLRKTREHSCLSDSRPRAAVRPCSRPLTIIRSIEGEENEEAAGDRKSSPGWPEAARQLAMNELRPIRTALPQKAAAAGPSGRRLRGGQNLPPALDKKGR